jgi:hypothetical protein
VIDNWSETRLRLFEGRLILAACVFLLLAASACEGNSSKVADSTSSVIVSDTSGLGNNPILSSPDSSAAPVAGPDVVIDSAATQPVLETRDNRFTLRLPLAMARVVYDTLPRFQPFPEATTYGTPPPGQPDSAESVIVGDFDGDSRPDVAMLGKSDTTTVFFMILAADSTRRPKIVFVDRATPIDPSVYHLHLRRPQRIHDPDNDDYFLDLRTDAIYMVSGEHAQLCYLDHGTVKYFSLTGD